MMTIEFMMRLFKKPPLTDTQEPDFEFIGEMSGDNTQDCLNKFMAHMSETYAGQLEEYDLRDVYYKDWIPLPTKPPATSSTVAINQDSTIE